MPNLVSEFNKEEIIKAMEYLDIHPEEFRGRESFRYDLSYKNKLYPPILVLSKANELKGGSKLTLSDFNGSTETSFKPLKGNGFTIIEKKLIQEFTPYLYDFLEQSLTDNLKSKKYSIHYNNCKVKASFGQGGVANVSWISFCLPPNTTSKGIYPVYLYFKKQSLLILAYGISETNIPDFDWKEDNKTLTIEDLFEERNLGKPFRYGSSYVYKSYDINNLPGDQILEKDLQDIIHVYDKIMIAQNSITLKEEINNQDFQFQTFDSDLQNSNLKFNNKLVKRFISSLITKPFLILTGLAGSGKTKLAQSFIQWICESEDQFKIVPVGADWINREPLLGYPNGLKSDEYVTPDNGVLELIMNSLQIENQNKPYFLVLDEMNLSHVERYFADFLSIIESGDSIKLYSGAQRKSTSGLKITNEILWPENLYIIGTVNIDETTYMFSPKVLDRANVIEFRLEESDLQLFLNDPQKVDLKMLLSKGTSMASSFLQLSKQKETEPNDLLNSTLLDFFNELKIVGAEFGYRSAYEIHLLFTQFSKIDPSISIEDKIDFAIMQKLLPKLHGSRSKIVRTLEALMKLCLYESKDFNISKINEISIENIKYSVSLDKLRRMYFNALSNGFTSYAEA